MTKKNGGADFKTVRIHTETYDAARALLETVSQHGWVSVGAKRDGGATLTAVIDEAVNALLRKASPQGRA
jgi:predicted negative regulator of RcsB-dependent stress response